MGTSSIVSLIDRSSGERLAVDESVKRCVKRVMAKVIDVREIVSSFNVKRDDGKVFRLNIIRFFRSKNSWFESYSYAFEVYEVDGPNHRRMNVPEITANDVEELKSRALAEIEKL